MATKLQIMTGGKIDVDKLPTADFSLETDPVSPEVGSIWWNETDKELKIADSAGVYAFEGVLTAWDTTPDAFAFTDITEADPETLYVSDAITVSGINYPVAISVTGATSAKYSINNGAATSEAGTVRVGDTVRAVVTSSALDETAAVATVTIGGVSATYSVTTAEGVVVPTTEYIGWDNTGGAPDSAPASSYSTQVQLNLRKWTADANGTLETVNIYAGPHDLEPRGQYVVVYKNVEGTLTLIAQGDFTKAQAAAWTGAVELSAADGQSLSFLSGDELYFGGLLAASSTVGQSYGFGRIVDTPGDTARLTGSAVGTVPKTTYLLSSMTVSTTTKLAAILEVTR